MKLNVLFFGATAEAAGTRSMAVNVGPDATVQIVFDSILAERPKLASHKLLFAVNREYSNGEEKVNDGDEIAIFTAVSGG
ncbi:MAG TPA: MoaD/ThiS family protein [Pyrinomonadaceae bacterium]|nr:MoaD/ThiS family protein [Pyrinomonadaceae bacterium]